jgi:hypothetical protein
MRRANTGAAYLTTGDYQVSKLKRLTSKHLRRIRSELLGTTIHVSLVEEASRLRDCLDSLIHKLEALERESDS